jgi:hypothetical protein
MKIKNILTEIAPCNFNKLYELNEKEIRKISLEKSYYNQGSKSTVVLKLKNKIQLYFKRIGVKVQSIINSFLN